jgi:hypothetical protein
VDDILTGASLDQYAIGANAVGLRAGSQAWICTSDQPQPTQLGAAGVPADATLTSTLVGAEQLASAPPAGVVGYLAQQSGSGLKASAMVLTVYPPVKSGAEEKGFPYHIAGDENSQFAALTCVGGVTVAAIAYNDHTDQTDKVERVAFDAAGAVLWRRIDVNNQNTGAASDVPLAFLTADSLTANQSGQVLFGVDDKWLAVDARTGSVAWTESGESSAGITFDSEHFMAVDSYNDGYGNGKSIYDKRTGLKVNKYQARSLSVDPIAGLLVISYTTEDSDLNNEPPNTPGSPAYEVISIDTGKSVFSIDRHTAEELGNIDVLGAFDGRAVVVFKDGTRVVEATSGDPASGFETIPPGTFRFSGIPYRSEANFALLADSNGFGEVEHDGNVFLDSVVIGANPLRWEDLQVAMVTD